ncbi:hypothetical protein [Chelatococcus reniformis]|nr:hypothetical protein [Chelatococcus reniformis]
MSASRPNESSVPTLCVGGIVLLAAFGGALLGGLEGAGAASFAALLVVGGGYSLLAWIFRWPGLQWHHLEFLIP